MLFAIISLALPLTAGADVLIEPRNDFFDQHINDIVYLRRDFYVNGRNGFVSVKTEPGSTSEIAVLTNGEIHQIQYTYDHNGSIWGVFDVEAPNKPFQEWQRGWVLMDDLLVVYDAISFEEDFANEISDYSGSIDTLFEQNELVFWKYPGSGVITQVWDESAITDPNRDFREWWTSYLFYTDSDGREWIAFPSMVKQWICLSDPSNHNIPAFNPAPEPEFRQPGDEHLRSPGGLPPPVLIIILVAAVAVVTAVLIRVFWKKSNTEKAETRSEK